MKGIEYKGVTSVDGPIVIVKRKENVFFGEIISAASVINKSAKVNWSV